MSKRKKLAKGCGWMTAIGAVATAALVYFYVDFPIAAMRLDAAEARARQAGVPLTQQELRRLFPFQPEQNSDPVYRRLLAEQGVALRDTTEGMRKLLGGQGLEPEEALRLAAEHSTLADELYEASKLPYVYLEADMDLTTQLRQVATFFSGRGHAYARMGRVEEAVRDLGTSRRVAGQVGQNPLLISAMVATALQSITMRSTQHAAEALAQNPEGLQKLEAEVLTWPESPADFRKSMLGEAHTTLKMYYYYPDVPPQDLLDGHPVVSSGASEVRRSGRPPGWVLQGSMARMLDAWAAYFEAIPESGATSTDFKEGARQMERVLDKSRLSYYMIQVLFSVMLQANLGADLQPRANHRITLAYLDVLQFRNQHGRWPESLAEAGVQAVDPFDDKPLRYRLDGEGFRIWSVGRNNLDDGGHTRTEVEGSDDLVATYPTIWPTPTPGSEP